MGISVIIGPLTGSPCTVELPAIAVTGASLHPAATGQEFQAAQWGLNELIAHRSDGGAGTAAAADVAVNVSATNGGNGGEKLPRPKEGEDRRLFGLLRRYIPAFRDLYKSEPHKVAGAFALFHDNVDKLRTARALALLFDRKSEDKVKIYDEIDAEIAFERLHEFFADDEEKGARDIVEKLSEMSWVDGAVLRDRLQKLLIKVFTRALFPEIGCVSFGGPKPRGRTGGWNITPEASAVKFLTKWLKDIKPLSDKAYGILNGRSSLSKGDVEGLGEERNKRYRRSARSIKGNLERISKMDELAQARIIKEALEKLEWRFSELKKVIEGLDLLAVPFGVIIETRFAVEEPKRHHYRVVVREETVPTARKTLEEVVREQNRRRGI